MCTNRITPSFSYHLTWLQFRGWITAALVLKYIQSYTSRQLPPILILDYSSVAGLQLFLKQYRQYTFRVTAHLPLVTTSRGYSSVAEVTDPSPPPLASLCFLVDSPASHRSLVCIFWSLGQIWCRIDRVIVPLVERERGGGPAGGRGGGGGSTRSYFMSHNDMENMRDSYWLWPGRGEGGATAGNMKGGGALSCVHGVWIFFF
jgi:hypothetical protein